jgi:hypothetical protein
MTATINFAVRLSTFAFKRAECQTLFHVVTPARRRGSVCHCSRNTRCSLSTLSHTLLSGSSMSGILAVRRIPGALAALGHGQRQRRSGHCAAGSSMRPECLPPGGAGPGDAGPSEARPSSGKVGGGTTQRQTQQVAARGQAAQGQTCESGPGA